MPRPTVPVVVLLLLALALAGCLKADDAAPPPSSAADTSRGGAGGGSTAPAAPRTTSSGSRWHFHNYWGTSDNVTLFDGAIHLGAEWRLVDDRPRVGSVRFVPEAGRIVPPETGRITVEVHWTSPVPERPLELWYRPADGAELLPAGAVLTEGVRIDVTEAMADAPHTGASAWEFLLEAAPDERGVAFANGTVHVVAKAWIGRPIIIDPPHRDHWRGRDVLEAATGAFTGRAARASDGYLVQSGTDTASAPSVLRLVPPNGTVVPAGTGALLVRLAWTHATPLAPPTAFVVRWSEGNTLTAGLAERESAAEGEATYRILVDPKSTDSPYTDRSTWVLDVELDFPGPPAFDGTLTAVAWAVRDAAAAVPG